jgi:hypothetical protein
MNKQKTLKRIRKAVDEFSDFLWDQTCQYNSHQPKDLWGYNEQVLLNVFKDMVKHQIKITDKKVKEKIKELQQERKMYEQRHGN